MPRKQSYLQGWCYDVRLRPVLGCTHVKSAQFVCVCCVSDVHARNLHASGLNTEQ